MEARNNRERTAQVFRADVYLEDDPDTEGSKSGDRGTASGVSWMEEADMRCKPGLIFREMCDVYSLTTTPPSGQRTSYDFLVPYEFRRWYIAPLQCRNMLIHDTTASTASSCTSDSVSASLRVDVYIREAY